jgi:hypothetical protein
MIGLNGFCFEMNGLLFKQISKIQTGITDKELGDKCDGGKRLQIGVLIKN